MSDAPHTAMTRSWLRMVAGRDFLLAVAAAAAVASEAADAVIAVDRIDRVARAVAIGRRSIRIARQSVIAGLGLSIVGMALAAAGYLPPVSGAIFQEVIDVAVILNALRALGGDGS
jgi:cation transport ATPase